MFDILYQIYQKVLGSIESIGHIYTRNYSGVRTINFAVFPKSLRPNRLMV